MHYVGCDPIDFADRTLHGGIVEYVPKSAKVFLRRKFAAPQLPSPYVREQVMSSAIMDEGSWRVCLVNASAGYGKTSLMTQWFHDFDSRKDCVALWMTLDEHDSSIGRLVRGASILMEPVDERFRSFHDGLAELDDPEDMLTDFVNLTDELCDRDKTYIVFLDGYDNAASPDLDRFLLFLNRYCDDNFRFVISGSYFSSQIDDLLLDSSVVEFRTHDLAFDEERLRSFAHALMPDLEESEFREICDQSGMWPTSFVFAHLAKKRSPGLDCSKIAKGYFDRFFGKEVMSRVDARTYEFLVETALLERLHPDLCDRVTGRSDSRSMLESLEARNLFVYYDHDQRVYLHQKAFRRYLLEKTLAMKTSYIAKLALRASGWYAERGMRNEQAKYLAATCDALYIQGSISSSMGLAWKGDHSSFLDYLIAQPAESFERDEYLAWVAVWAFVSVGLPDEARHWISVAREIGRGGGSDLAYDYANAICLALEGDSRSSISVIRRILKEGGGDLPRAFQCLLIHMEAENCERLGSPREGRDLYLKALSLAERADGAFYKLFDMYCIAHQCLYTGDLDDAVSFASRALESCEETSSLYGEFHAIIAFVDIERRDLQSADRHLAIAERRVSSGANVDMYIDVRLTRARYEYALGNAIEALEIVSDVISAVSGKRVPRNLDMEAYALLAQLAIEAGDDAAVRRAGQVMAPFMSSLDFLRVIPCMISHARILWSVGDAEGCLDVIAQCRQLIHACSSTYLLVETNVLEAAVHSRLGNDAQAMVCIGKAIEVSMRGGYLNVFSSGGKAVRELVLELATSRKTSLPIRTYAKKILMLNGTEFEVNVELAMSEGDVKGYYALTEREKELLHALNSGMSRIELAEAFGVSQNTVKTHLKNIYAKLGVHTRAEAYRASQDVEPTS